MSKRTDREFHAWLILNEHYIGHRPAGARNAGPFRECRATVCEDARYRLGLGPLRRRKKRVLPIPSGLNALPICRCEAQGHGLEQLICREPVVP